MALVGVEPDVLTTRPLPRTVQQQTSVTLRCPCCGLADFACACNFICNAKQCKKS